MLPKHLTRQFLQIPKVLSSAFSFATAHHPHHCQSNKELHNIFNPALMANLPNMQKMMTTTNLGLQYYNFLLDCFAETKILQSNTTLLQLILQKLADPETYKGQVYTNEEVCLFSFRIIKNFLRLLRMENEQIMQLVDGAYPVFTRFSKHLLEKQGLISYSQFEEIYDLIDEYLDQDYQTPYITFLLEEFQSELSSILSHKHQKLLTQQQRKSVIRDYIHPDVMPYLSKCKIESYSRDQRLLKVKLDNNRNILLFGNLDNKISEGDFELVKELMQECKSVPILITEDNPIEYVQKQDEYPMNFKKGQVEKQIEDSLDFKIQEYQNLGFKKNLKGEDLYKFMNSYMQPEKYDIDFENINVWKKYKEEWEFNPMATAYFTYLNEFVQRDDLKGQPEIYLAKLPKSFQNNELMQRYSKEEMENMLYLCKYTQLLEVTRYMYKYENDTSHLPCPVCNKQFKVRAPPLPKGYLNVLNGENLYSLSQRDNYFMKQLANILKNTTQDVVIITSYRNFYGAVASAVSNGEYTTLRKDQQQDYNFVDNELNNGRKEILKFINDQLSQGPQYAKEYFEKQTILDVINNLNVATTELVNEGNQTCFDKYAHVLSWEKVLESVPEKDREVLRARTKKEQKGENSCFIYSSIFTAGQKRMVKRSTHTQANQQLQDQFLAQLKKACGVNV